MLDVTWHINSQQDLLIGSKILSGLSALRRKGHLSLRFIPNVRCPKMRDELVLWTVRDKDDSGPARRLVIDLLDTSEFICPVGLNYADVYFKRDLMLGPLELLPVHLRKRVRPFGLNNICYDARSWPDWLAASAVRARMTAATDLRSAVNGFIEAVRLFTVIPGRNAFIARPEEQKRPFVLFQTRVWPPQRSGLDLEPLNRERVRLAMTLGSALGERFVGGIVGDEFARTQYPEAVVRKSVRQLEYAALTRSALVGVYSRGVHGSLAYKLSEYMAAGCCMVVEPWEHILDVPLESGVHYLPYHSAESCVAACETLLADKTLAAEMSRRNADYYLRYLLPERQVERILAAAVAAECKAYPSEGYASPQDSTSRAIDLRPTLCHEANSQSARRSS